MCLAHLKNNSGRNLRKLDALTSRSLKKSISLSIIWSENISYAVNKVRDYQIFLHIDIINSNDSLINPSIKII